MKLLSENKYYEYYAVTVLRAPEILGVIGKDSKLSEHALNELGYNGMTVDGKLFPHPSDAFEYDLKQKGVLIENPIPKPLRDNYTVS